MNAILLTGGTGFLGRHLIKQLNYNYKIFVLTRNKQNFKNSTQIKCINYNQINYDLFFKSNKIKIIIHAATNYGRENNFTGVIEANIYLPITLIQNAIKYNVKAFINIDTFYNNGKNLYSYLPQYTMSKKFFFDWYKSLNDKKLIFINAKLGLLYGPNDQKNKFVFELAKNLLNNRLIKLTKGLQKRDFTYVVDAANGIHYLCNKINLFEKCIHELYIGTGQLTTVKAFTIKAKQIFKSKSKLKFGALTYRENEIFKPKCNTITMNSFGWKHKFNLENGLKNYLMDLKNNDQ